MYLFLKIILVSLGLNYSISCMITKKYSKDLSWVFNAIIFPFLYSTPFIGPSFITISRIGKVFSWRRDDLVLAILHFEPTILNSLKSYKLFHFKVMKNIWIECKGAKIRWQERFLPFNRLIKTFRRFRFEFWTFTLKRIEKQHFTSENLAPRTVWERLKFVSPLTGGFWSSNPDSVFTRTLVHYKPQAHFFYSEIHMLSSQLGKLLHPTSKL